jgi:hypothetical protein
MSVQSVQTARGLAIYDWSENFEFGQNPNFLLKLIEDLKIRPRKMAFGLGNERTRSRTVYKNSNLLDLIAEFKNYDLMEICTPIDGNYLRVEFSLSYVKSENDQTYMVQMPVQNWSVNNTLNHLKLLAKHLTPTYGFSIVMPSSQVGWFQSGMSTMSMTNEETKRASELAYTIGSHGHLQHEYGKLHDVYELNVLSPIHLKRDTFGQTLASWIGVGKRGELLEIKSNLFVWLVPDSIRSAIRASFLNAGLLISPV